MRDGASWSAAGAGTGLRRVAGGRVIRARGSVEGVARGDDAKALYLGLQWCGTEIGSGGRWPRPSSSSQPFSRRGLGVNWAPVSGYQQPPRWLSAREESYL